MDKLLTMRFLVALLLFSPAPGAGLFDYDRSVPLDVKLSGGEDREDYRLQAINFANPNGARVKGYVAVPHGGGRKPAVIWMHSGGAFQWLGDVILLARAGAVSLIIEPPDNNNPPTAEGFLDDEVQSVIAIRRAIDVLAAREDVDAKRIGYAGHSYGAIMGAVASSVDGRFRAAVFEAGLLGMSIHIGTSPHSWAEGKRKEIGAALPRFLKVISAADATPYIGQAAGFPKLFQSAWFDPGVPHKDSEDFFRAASGPKEMRWYDTGHDIDDLAAIADRARFLGKALDLPKAERVLREKIRGSRR